MLGYGSTWTLVTAIWAGGVLCEGFDPKGFCDVQQAGQELCRPLAPGAKWERSEEGVGVGVGAKGIGTITGAGSEMGGEGGGEGGERGGAYLSAMRPAARDEGQ